MDNKTKIIMEIGDTKVVVVDASMVEAEVEEDTMEDKRHEMHLISRVIDVKK